MSMVRRLLVLVVGIALAVGAACVTAPAAGQPGARIAPGVVVYGVPLGGLSSEPARRLLRDALSRPLPVVVDGVERRVVPETFGLAGSVDEAVADGARGSRAARARREARPSSASGSRATCAGSTRGCGGRPATRGSSASSTCARGSSGGRGRRVDRKRLQAAIARGARRGPARSRWRCGSCASSRSGVSATSARSSSSAATRTACSSTTGASSSPRSRSRPARRATRPRSGRSGSWTCSGTRGGTRRRRPSGPAASSRCRPGPGTRSGRAGWAWTCTASASTGRRTPPRSATRPPTGASAWRSRRREWLFERVRIGTPVVIAPA